MASIKSVAREWISEMRDGIGWLVVGKSGRSWVSEMVYPNCDGRNGTCELDDDDLDKVEYILSLDSGAIAVSSYYHNLGDVDDLTIDDLAHALLWQYDLGYAKADDLIKGVI